MSEPQSGETPVVYIFHGDDPHAIRQQVDELVKQLVDPPMAELNVTRLDGRQAGEDDLRAAANSMPFLAERRVVLLSHPFARATTDDARKRFQSFLDGLPPSTALVLIVDDELERGDWRSLPFRNTFWMRKWIAGAGKKVSYRLCRLPQLKEMPGWIREEARRQGGQFKPDAAVALAGHVGNDTQLASLEIAKLLTYVDFKRPVEDTDVDDLTAQGGQADVFSMVDALASGNARQALEQLHRLLETQEPLILFAMIVRQFRLLIQARELIDEGRGAVIESELRVHSFVAEKLAKQARRFHMAELVGIFHRLLALDETLKSSQMPPDLALDTFVAELAR